MLCILIHETCVMLKYIGLSLIIWLLLTLNAAGSVGDFYVVVRLLFAPTPLLIHDHGDGMTWYRGA